MKNITHLPVLLVLFSLLGCSSINGQSMNVSSYIEKTPVSPKIGISIGYNFQYKVHGYSRLMEIEVGGFYQKSSVELEETGGILPYEKDLLGLYFESTIVRFNHLKLDFGVRVGYQNNENFILTPNAKTSLLLGERLEIGAGLGLRQFMPTTIINIKIHI
jgi:hypothetical protein